MVKSSKFWQGRLNRYLREWHRKLGIVAAFFLIFLSITGIALNHTDSFKLAHYNVKSTWLLDHYGIKAPNQLSFYSDNITVTDHLVWLKNTLLLEVSTPVVSIGVFQNYILIATEQSFYIYSQEGKLVDKLGVSSGLPLGITEMFLGNNNAIVKTAMGYYQTDSDFFDWQKITPITDPNWIVKINATQEQKSLAILNYKAQFLTWERIIVDTHSGRFFGIIGVYFMDVVALLLILLSVSGIYIWIRHARANR
ncbi:MAG: PepSY domain-containing protein [Colwellia sp.]|nr:PepSY domain-containing protein [Colwellia sp.]